MRIAVLGAGIMGAPMARNLASAGHEVTVWNRTRAKAEGLGATVADSPAEAAEGAGSRLKLVVNAWLIALVEGLAETIALAEGLGIDPRRFIETIDGGPMGPPYAKLKGTAMIERSFEPSFPLKLAAKDAGLVADAARAAGLDLPLPAAIRDQMAKAVEAGHGDEDMAATIEASRPPSSQARASGDVTCA